MYEVFLGARCVAAHVPKRSVAKEHDVYVPRNPLLVAQLLQSTEQLLACRKAKGICVPRQISSETQRGAVKNHLSQNIDRVASTSTRALEGNETCRIR